MPLPDVSVAVSDGALGLVATTSDQAHAVVGVCSSGTVNTVYSFGDIKTLVASLGAGPAVEAAAHSLAIAGGPIYVVPINQTTPGSPGSVTTVGSGPAVTVPALSAVVSSGTAPPVVTLTGTPLLFVNLVVQIVVGGVLATATFKVSTDGGVTYGSTIATAATYVVPGTGVTLNFAAGTYTNDNVYRASSCVPNDIYEVQVKVVAGGTLGVATYQYALDNGYSAGGTFSPILTTPATASPTYIIPGTGITLTFAAGTYIAGTTYSFNCTAPAYTTTDVTNAMTALLANPTEWACVHLVGQASSSANSAAMASVLDTIMSTAFAAYRFTFALMEAFDDEAASNANLVTAFASFASTRVCVAAGFERVTSVLSGRFYKRSAAFPIAARLSKVPIGTDLGRVADGALPAVATLLHDEQVSPNLDTPRFSSLRSIVGRQGYYISNGRMMASAGSDYQYMQFRRVMDRACKTARQALLQFLNASVRVNADGTIYEVDARNIEAYINGLLSAALVAPGQASASSVVVNRTANVLSTTILPVTVRVTPLGYAKSITLDVGFLNPNLVAK